MKPADASPVVTLTWEGGNHLSDEDYVLERQVGAAVPAPDFNTAVRQARAAAIATTHAVPGTHGLFTPMHVVRRAQEGYEVLRLARADGHEPTIDGPVADGSTGFIVRGAAVRDAGALVALVGASSVLDLRDAPSESAKFWRDFTDRGASWKRQ